MPSMRRLALVAAGALALSAATFPAEIQAAASSSGSGVQNAAPPPARFPADRDWGKTLREDATAIHDAIASSHPGMVNPDDPQFARMNEAQYALALTRADAADSFADYFYALQHYVAAFNDGHLGFGVYGSTPDKADTWPGFIAKDDGARGLVVTVAEPWAGVAVGDRISSCDGRDAFQVGNERIGARFGRWELASQRLSFGGWVMIDTGDPYVTPIQNCVFETPAGVRAVELDWRPAGPDFYSRYDVFPARTRGAIGMRLLDDGRYWITLPTFNGDPESEDGRSLVGLITQIAAQADALRTAPAVVFDLRGNGGGSSLWSHRIAESLWGPGAFQHAPEPPMTVVWRASDDNLQAMRANLEKRDANGNLSSEARAWYQNSIAGLEQALASGDDRWVIRPDLDSGSAADAEGLAFQPPQGTVVVLTDETCMSACLDAVDLWLRLGTKPIGRETGADAVYMEVRSVRVPSGLGAMSLPMKFYIGRERGHNQPVTPLHRFDGDMNDTAALEAWTATLPH
jgi:hypothetical protein